MPGEIRRAVIRRLSDQRRIPIGAAAHAYACMSIARKKALCDAEQMRRAIDQRPAERDSHADR